MAAIIKNISITQKQQEFLDNHSHFSLSKIAQSKINEIMDNHSDLTREIERLKAANIRLTELIKELHKQIGILEQKKLE